MSVNNRKRSASQSLQENQNPSKVKMQKRPNFSSFPSNGSGGIKSISGLSASKPGDIKKLVIKNFKAKPVLPENYNTEVGHASGFAGQG